MGDPPMVPWVVDCNSGREEPSHMFGRLPRLTRTRAACGGHWAADMGRLLTVEETLDVVGLPVSSREKGALGGALGCADRAADWEHDPHGRAHDPLARVLTKLGPAWGC